MRKNASAFNDRGEMPEEYREAQGRITIKYA